MNSWFSSIPTPVFQGLGPLFAILYSFFMGMRETSLTSPTFSHYRLKISGGFFAAAIAFMILLVAISLHPGDEKVPMIWIILTYLWITIAEMCIVPTCLSAIIAFSPPRLKGPFVALWTLSIAYGTYFSGVIVKYSSIIFPPIFSMPSHECDYFGIFLITALICLLMSFIVLPFVHFNEILLPLLPKYNYTTNLKIFK